MSTIVEGAELGRVTKLALGLTSSERSLLLAKLYDSLEAEGRDPDYEGAWAAEIERRVREVENGEAELIDHEVAMERLRKRFS